MTTKFLQHKRWMFVALGLVMVSTLILSQVAVGQAAVPSGPARPLELSVLQLPGKTLGPSTAYPPTTATITFISKNGPFCLQGLVVGASPSAPVAANQFGDVTINLDRIDGFGLSHPNITLVDSTTGGFSQYDLVLNYGGPICAAKSVQFEVIQWEAQIGPGVTMTVMGEAIISTASGNTVTVK